MPTRRDTSETSASNGTQRAPSSLCLARTSTHKTRPASFVGALQSNSLLFFLLLLDNNNSNNNNLSGFNPNAIPSSSRLLIPARISSKTLNAKQSSARNKIPHLDGSSSSSSSVVLSGTSARGSDRSLAGSTIRVAQRSI